MVGQGGGNDVAFFNFGTNAKETEEQIVSALSGIQRAVNSLQTSPTTVGVDTKEFQESISRVKANVDRALPQIQEQLGRLSSGEITRGEFNESYRRIVRQNIGEIPNILAQELAQAPDSVKGRLDVSTIARTAARDAARYLQEYTKSVGRLSGTLPSKFAVEAIGQVAKFPIDLNPENIAPREYLKLQQFAEQLAKADFTGQLHNGEDPRAIAQRLGLSGTVNRIQDTQFTPKYDEKGELIGHTFEDIGVTQTLKELEAAYRNTEAAALRMKREQEAVNKVLERQAQLDAEVARAQRLVDEGFISGKRGVLVDANGNPFKSTTAGARETANPLDVQAAEQALERQQNVARLLANGPLKTVGGKYNLGDEFFDRQGNRVTEELEINRLLQERDALLEKEAKDLEKTRALAEARAAAEANGGVAPERTSFTEGAVGRFNRGGAGFLGNLGAQVASAASFTFGYGLLFAAQGALRDTLHEFEDYQDSVTDLQVAMSDGNTVSLQYIDNLSELSRVAGSNVGAALDAAARGVRAFSDVQASQTDKDSAGFNTARAASQLSVIADKTLPDATGDTIAIGTAFGLKPEQLDNVVDAIANAKRNVGGDAGQISQGLALISLSAQEAGFSLNEAAAVIGLVQARTDESGQAIATRLTRIFQIVQGSTGKQLAEELKDKLDPLGVNGQSSVKDQIEAYAKIYSDPKTSEATKDRIASSLGGTANLRELLPLLRENTTLQRAYAQALSNAGQGLDEYQRKSNNLVGVLKKIAGDVSYLQKNLSTSGLFDGFAAGVEVLEPALYALNKFLVAIEELEQKVPGMRQVLGVLIDIALASKAIAVVQTAQLAKKAAEGGVAKTVAATTTTGARGAESEADTAAAEAAINYAVARRAATDAEATATERELATKEAATIAANALAAAQERQAITAGEAAVGTTAQAAASTRVGIAGGAAALGRFAANPYVAGAAAIIGVAALVGKQLQDDEKRNQIDTQYKQATPTALGSIDGSSSSFVQAAADIRAVAQRIEKTDVFYVNKERDVHALDDRASGVQFFADRIAKEEQYAAALQRSTIFGNGAIETVDQLAVGLQRISENGGTAITQYNSLVKALNTPVPQGKELFTSTNLAGQIYASLVDAFGNPKNFPDGAEGIAPTNPAAYRATGGRGAAAPPYSVSHGSITTNDKDTLATLVPVGEPGTLLKLTGLDKLVDDVPKAVLQLVRRQIRSGAISPTKGITPDQIAELTKEAADLFDLSSLTKGSKDYLNNVIKEAVKGLKDRPLYNPDTPIGALNGSSLSPADIKKIINPQKGENGVPDYAGLVGSFNAALQAVPESDDGSQKLNLLKTQRATLQKIIDKGLKYAKDNPKKARAILQQLAFIRAILDNADHDLAAESISQLEDLRAAAESRTTSGSELAKVRQRFAVQEFRKAGTDKNLIEQVMESLDKRTVDAVLAYEKQARDTTRLALQHARDLYAATIAALGQGGAYSDSGLLSQEKNIDKLKKRLDKQNDAIKAFLNVLPGANIGSDTPSGGNTDPGEVRAAQAAAQAAQLGGGIAQAKASIVAAKVALDKADKGTVEWFNALAQLYQAQQQLSDANLAYANTLDQLHGDITDPVENARDALRAALRKLRSDAGAGKDVRAEDRLAVEQAQNSLESSKFSQRLSDVQTAEQLGKISHAAYIRYLENESKRLHSIGHKTRQQIDEMNQIDLALKEASDQLAGSQFNLGDINTNGLVYQVRRFLSESGRGPSAANNILNGGKGYNPATPPVYYQQNSGNTITINGADTAAVRRLLRELLGPQTQTRTTSSRRR